MSTLTPLNPKSPVPLYHQLARSLAAAIGDGTYSAGQKLPSEPALAKYYGVTRPTVREATRLLASRRLVEARRGAGTFVSQRPERVDLFSLAGTLAAFEKSGLEVRRRLLDAVRLVPVAQEAEQNPFAGQTAFQFRRLTEVESKPVLLEEFYVAPNVFPELALYNLSMKSFADVVREHYFMVPERGRQTFQATLPNAERRRLLGLTRAQPVLEVRRCLDFPGAPSAIYCELFCRTDEFSFSQTLEENR